MTDTKNYFNELNQINVSDKTEKKNGLTYLSWAWAWGEIKKLHPDATYKIYENLDGWNYFTDGRTCWVKTSVTVAGIENIEYLPIMDFKNQSIGKDRVTSFDVNKAIQRSLTKCCARHGLGLYIYAGEDLPEAERDEKPTQPREVGPTQIWPTPDLFKDMLAFCTSSEDIQTMLNQQKMNPRLRELVPLATERKKELEA